MCQPYGATCDVWACGCIIYCLLGGVPPFEDSKVTALMKKIRRGKYDFNAQQWKDVSPEVLLLAMLALLLSCLQP